MDFPESKVLAMKNKKAVFDTAKKKLEDKK